MKKLITVIMLFLSFAVAGAGASYAAVDARIDDLVITDSPAFAVSFAVKNAFTKEIEEAIKSGVPTSFKFIIKLSAVNSLWFNDEIAIKEFKHTVKYDTLKEEYEVTLDENGAPVRTKDFNEMKTAMTTVSVLPIETLPELSKGAVYELKLMAELRTVKLPFLLDYMLFFVKFWDFDTGWHTHRFIR
jgi:hypothetical protein